ncbi:NB-ARC domain-containing protein [Streptomyces sp. LX-29]|nr:NB-ARC domain-containing protein [Streptomyces sp. LX-29]
MRYGILGTTQVHRPDGNPVALGGARLRALLTALALRPGRARPIGALIAEVWPEEPPQDAPAALQALVGRLRRALGREAVLSVPGGYQLAAASDDVDLHRFERGAEDGARALADGDPERAGALLDEALALWRGPALADLPGGTATAAHAEARRLGARRLRAEADLARGRAEAALLALTGLCAAHPLDEPLHALRIRALRAAGRPAEALAAYEDVRQELAERLGADPGAELRALHKELLEAGPGGAPDAVDPGAARTAPGPGGRGGHGGHGNLRARLTSFVGREVDLAALRADLTTDRLVTLTGPGGSGKTRLAQEAAEAVAGDWPDGVWLAELAPVEDPDTVAEAVLTTLGGRETVIRGTAVEELRAAADPGARDPLARLAEHCAQRRLLLVLDNCEHVIDAAARLAEALLTRCPGVTVLATSREPLAVPGESVRPVEPLTDATALRLLQDRGASARPGFRTDEDPEASAEICRRLDGLPLAIELAAARLRLLTPRQLADRLDDRFRLLTSGSRTVLPRQQTLRAVVDWSWELLDERERTVLRRLSVFAGGCDLPAAEAVCADPPPAAAPAAGTTGGAPPAHRAEPAWPVGGPPTRPAEPREGAIGAIPGSGAPLGDGHVLGAGSAGAPAADAPGAGTAGTGDTNAAAGPSGTRPMGAGQTGAGLVGAGLSGAGPVGAGPVGAGPMGAGPTGAGPSGGGPTGSRPSGGAPSVAGPMGAALSGVGPSGAVPSGAGPVGAGLSGAGPVGAGLSGAGPVGAGLSGAGPTGAGPSGGGPTGSRPSGGAPSVAGPVGAALSGVGPSGAVPSGAGPVGAGLSGAGPTGAGPSGGGPTGSRPSGGAPSVAGPVGAALSGTGPSGAALSGAVPSVAGPMDAAPSGAGPVGAGSSGAGPSGARPSGGASPAAPHVDPRDVAALLGSLVDKSLVVAAPDLAGPGAGGDTMRYRMLETVAEYAAERLAEAGERGVVERRHLVTYRELARTADPLLRGHGQRGWLDRLEREHDNLRAALRRAVAAGDEQEALCLVLSLGWFWQLRGHSGDARHWSAAAARLGPDPYAAPVAPAPPLLTRPTDAPPPMPPELLEEARRGARLIELANLDGDVHLLAGAEAQRRLAGIVTVYRPGLPQTCRIPGVMWFYALILAGDVAKLYAAIDGAVRTCRELGLVWELAFALHLRAKIVQWRQRHGRTADDDSDESLELFIRAGDAWGAAEALSGRGEAREQRGEYERAADDYRAAIRYAEELGALAQVDLLRARLAGAQIEAGGEAAAAEGERALRAVLAAEHHTDTEALVYARLQLALRCAGTGRTEEARAQLHALAAFANRSVGLFQGLVEGLLGWLDVLDGRPDEALPKVRGALARTLDPVTEMVAPHLPINLLLTAARALVDLDAGAEADRAARLIGAYDTLRPPVKWLPAIERGNRTAAERAARGALGDLAYERAHAAGGALSLHDAAALV